MLITGSKIRKLRNEAGLTQKMLAELIGVSQAHVAKIESSKVDPRLSTVNKILGVLIEERRRCKDLMAKEVLFAKPDDSILEISDVMIKEAISQMPVLNEKRVIGTITERDIIKNLNSDIANQKAEDIMSASLPTASEETTIDLIRPMLERHQGVLVTRDREIVGILTRSDLLKTIS